MQIQIQPDDFYKIVTKRILRGFVYFSQVFSFFCNCKMVMLQILLYNVRHFVF